MNIYENKNICAKCGGKCCLEGGCDYLVSDIEEFNIQNFCDLLESGKASIKAILNENEIESKKNIEVILILKSRNINRGAIDLISIETPCSLLTATGCFYPFLKRPGFARHLIPDPNYECYSDLNYKSEYLKWRQYQSVLENIIKEKTGLSKYEEFRKELEEFFYNILHRNFEDASVKSIKEAHFLLNYLKRYYENEYERALINSNSPKLNKKR